MVDKNYSAESAASEFMSTVPDDVLLEILIQLPRLGPAMTVCKNWYSLIMSDHPNAFHRHTVHHDRRRQQGHNPDPSYTPPYTVLITSKLGKPGLQLHSEKSKILLRSIPNYKSSLGFVLSLSYKAIKASFNDSVLIHLEGQYFICNLTTQEQRLLPNPRLNCHEFHGAKFALLGNGSRFRVVVFGSNPFMGSNHPILVFSSETSEWRKSSLQYQPTDTWVHTVVVAGAVHWADLSGLVYVYDPFRPDDEPDTCRIINPPALFVNHYRMNMRLGEVGGRLRVAQTTLSGNKAAWRPYLRIWELENGEDGWSLVKEVYLRRGIKLGEPVGVVAFHPGHGDVVFVSRGSMIYRCEFKNGESYEVKVLEVPESRRDCGLHIHLPNFTLLSYLP